MTKPIGWSRFFLMGILLLLGGISAVGYSLLRAGLTSQEQSNGLIPDAAWVGQPASFTGLASWPSNRERGVYQAKIAQTGKLLWDVRWETNVSRQSDVVQVKITEEGSGQPLRYNEPIRWEKQMVLSANVGSAGVSPVQFQSVEGTRWTNAGELLSRMDVRADPSRRQILYVDSEGRTTLSRTMAWTPQAFPDELLFHWVRTLPFDQLQRGGNPLNQRSLQKECTLILSPTQQFKINARLSRKEEDVNTPAGTFSCYRVDLVPKLLGPLKSLAPKMALWCTTAAPHYWVRYQGPVGGPGSPQAVIELVKFETDSS